MNFALNRSTLRGTYRRTFVAIAYSAFLVGCATTAPVTPSQIKLAADGTLTNAAGMTLYTFDRDQAGNGKSVCNGQCAINWPPVMAGSEAAAGDYSAVTRDDGNKQLAYQGKPLYLWIKDQKPGDKTGDGVNNVWRVAK